MEGIDTKTLAVAQQYAEQLALGGAGLQEKVESSVNVYLSKNPETEFLNIKKNGAKGDGVTDDSACFSEGVPGYIVNDGTYCVDGATMARLNENNCIGNGYLKLYNAQLWGNDGAEKWYAPFDYTIAVKDLGNFLQKQMVSASEADYYADLNRKNATAMLKPLEGLGYAHTIGAVYKIQNAVLPDNFTVCIGNLQLYEITTDKVLKRLRIDNNLQSGSFGLFELPWAPEVRRELAADSFTVHDNYTEFHLKASDFEGTANGKTESVLHFWGNTEDLGDRDDIIGLICCFDFWVKEDEARDKLIIQIGVDQFDYNTKTIKQACSGIAMKIENYPRTQWSTSMNRELLDLYVDSNRLAYLHSLPIDDVYNDYNALASKTDYESTFVAMKNGDLYHKMFDDYKTYRGLHIINPVKQMVLPYYNTNYGSTGAYCKLFSIPIVTDSTKRCVFKIDITKQTSSKSTSYLSALLTIINGGAATIEPISSYKADEGLLTVIISSETIDVYAKGVAYGYVTAKIELLFYSHIDLIQTISYDVDLLRVAAGAVNMLSDKWTSVNTTDCTVVKSSKTTALEDRVAALETKIAELTTATTE